MAGRQVQIYATPEDFASLERAFRRTMELVSISCRPHAPAVEPANFSLGLMDMGKKDLKICLARPDDLEALIFAPVPSQSHWAIDCLRSPVVEFRRCYLGAYVLRRGRLYFNGGYYQEGRWLEKPEPFLHWADMIFKTTKRVFRRDPSLDAYIGEHAATWRTQPNRQLSWK